MTLSHLLENQSLNNIDNHQITSWSSEVLYVLLGRKITMSILLKSDKRQQLVGRAVADHKLFSTRSVPPQLQHEHQYNYNLEVYCVLPVYINVAKVLRYIQYIRNCVSYIIQHSMYYSGTLAHTCNSTFGQPLQTKPQNQINLQLQHITMVKLLTALCPSVNRTDTSRNITVPPVDSKQVYSILQGIGNAIQFHVHEHCNQLQSIRAMMSHTPTHSM